MGGLEALKVIMADLPKTLGASIFVVLHVSADSPGLLAGILERRGALPARTVKTIEHIQEGVVYVAAPDHHLVVERGMIVRATKGPKENRFRPAVDPLFRSAAQAYGPCVIGVILTGALDDGTAGLWAVKELGGTAVVQDPAEAFAPSMPQSAMQHVVVDHCVPLSEIAPLLARLTSEHADQKGVLPMPKGIGIEVDIASARNALERGVLALGEPSNFACPDCHGVLLRMKEATRIRFRCHTGHAYSAESLMAEIDEAVEAALWNAIRAVEESALLMRHLAIHAGAAHDVNAKRLEASALNAHRRAELVRQAVLNQSGEARQ